TVAGGAVAISALRKTQGAGIAFSSYWRSAVAPVLMSGYRPPLADGFARFVAVESVAVRVAAAVREVEAGPHADPFDTHPSLRERIAAISLLPQTDEGDTRTAAELLGDTHR